MPSVQTKLGERATNYLKKEFDVAIDVHKVDLSILGNVQLKEIFIKDHHNDTLIFIENLTTSVFSYRNMINNKMEFGQISLDNFKLYIKTYKGEDNDALSIFADKFDNSEKAEEPSGFILTATDLNLRKGFVEISDQNKPENKPLFFKKIKGTAENFRVEGPNVSTNINALSFVENHLITVIKFASTFSYTKKQMNFQNTLLETDNSTLRADLYFKYNHEDLSDFNNKVDMEVVVKKASVSLVDAKKFYDELEEEDVLHFTTNISGTLNNFTTHHLILKSDKNVVIEGDINFKNSFNKENGFSLNANLTSLIADYQYLTSLFPNILGDSMPPFVEKLGRLKIKGITQVTEDRVDAQLTVNTDIGKAITDLKFTGLNTVGKTGYNGNIEIIDVDLGYILNNPLFGQLSMEANIEGSGFSLEKLNASVKSRISKYLYKGYTYRNINIDGLVKNKLFDGEMEVNDDHIKLNFNGLADLSSERYKFDFETVVDFCDLNNLNLFKRDSISNIKGEIGIKVTGNSIDDLIGTVLVKNSSYTNQKDNYFFKNFNITSSFSDSIRTITVNSSDIIEGRIRGLFKFNELGKLTKNSIGSIYSNYNPFEVTPGQNLDFRFQVYNKIVEVFYPEVTLAPNTSIRGNIIADKNLFKLSIKSPEVNMYEYNIDNLNVLIDNKNPIFNTQLTIDKVTSGYYDITKLRLLNKTLNDTLYFRTEFKGGKNKTEDFNLAFYHTFNKENKSVFGVQNSNFTFKNNYWNINPDNNLKSTVVFDSKSNTSVISPFIITSGNQKIEFFGSVNDTISKDLKFNFSEVKLASITPKIDSLDLKGEINGNLNYKQLGKRLSPSGNLSLSKFKINNSLQGDLNIVVEGKNSVKKYGVDISLKRENDISFSAVGEIDFTPKIPTLDIVMDFEEFKLDAFSPLGEDVFNNIRGYVYGNVNLTGAIANPDMTGDLFLDQAGMYFPYLNVDYDFEGTSVINLNKQTFDFEDVTLKDMAHGTRGKLTGTLQHSHFNKWLLDMNLSTNNLLVLNTKEEEGSVYFGTGFLEGIATIKGPTDRLVIDVIGKTKKNTHFVIPISDVKTVQSSEFIRFVNRNEEEQTEEVRKAFISEKLKGLTMNFNLEVTKDAVVEMVLDQATGSFLKGSGTGNLQIGLDTKDKFEMFGDFIIDNGKYNFKYGGIINKPFTVKKGGSISWNGDPYTANIDLEAVYRVSANPKSLLENITANRKIPINLVTRFSGELFNSKREFDIEIPNSSSTIASELAFKLNDNDENRKTVHFMALLATGSFYNENDFSVNSSGLVYGTASDMLSNAFDNIFNKGDNRFKFKPVYTAAERHRVDNLKVDAQLSLALDYQVNDRIIINGKVGVPIGSKEQSNVIGEVNVEFLMNEEGTLRSTLFNRQNEIQYTEEEEGYTQGVGMSYQIDFDNGKELLEKLGLKKKKSVDSLAVKKTLDSIIKKKELIKFKSKKKEQ